MIDHQITDTLGAGVTVSALPPDVIPLEGIDAVPRLNLFLHQATPNLAWRNALMPTHDGAGRRTTNPPLALDLHYLLTAYGIEELQAEVLLGYGLLMLHETPVLTREAIRTALQPSPVSGAILPSVFQALRAARSRRPDRAAQADARGDEPGGDVAPVVCAAGALPADLGIRRQRRADRAPAADPHAAAGAHTRPLRRGAAARRRRDRRGRPDAAVPDADRRQRGRARDAGHAARR